MDQLKHVLAVAKKHHFWVLVGLVIALGLLIYVAAAADLKNRYETRDKTLKSASASISSVSPVEHPNQKSNENWEAVLNQQRRMVFEGWQMLYDKQKAENPWPAVLDKKFHLMVEKLQPNEELSSWALSHYQNEIQKYIPQLFAKVDYRRQVPDESAGTGAPGAGPGKAPMGLGGMRLGGMESGGMESGGNTAMKWVGIVDVNKTEVIDRIYQELEFAQRPDTKLIFLRQENLWVYEALLNIIKQTNKGATSQSNAIVKQILALEIGRIAAEKIAPTATPGSTGAASGMGMGMGMSEGGEGMGMGMGVISGGAAAATSGSTDEMLRQNRYVNDQLMPLAATEPAPYAEFNMMPVRLVLVVDGRNIPDLLVQCANSTMPVEVKLLRMISTDPGGDEAAGASGLGSGGGFGASGFGGLEGEGRGGAMGFGGARSEAGAGAIGLGGAGGLEALRGAGSFRGAGNPGETSQEDGINRYCVALELHGIIYLYNPPDRAKLATGTVAEQPTGGAGPEGAPAPATETPPGTELN